MTYRVSGQTFHYRDMFKDMGGQWDKSSKTWEFDRLSMTQVARIRALPGVLVVEPVNHPRAAPTPGERARQEALETGLARLHSPRGCDRSNPTFVIGDDPTHFGTFRDEDPITYFGFSSISKLCDYVESLERPDNIGGRCDIGWSTSERRIKATGTKTMQEAIDIARRGWTEGLGVAHIFDIPHALNKRRSNALAGGSVNVGRMLAGHPVHMRKRTPQPKSKRITLFVELSVWQGISAANLMLRALFIASVVDLLEKQSYSCTIYACCSSRSFHDYGAQSQLCIEVKRSGERLSLLDLSFSLGHPSLLRRFHFACEGVFPEVNIGPENRGLVSQCFDDQHTPPRDCYYIKQLPSRHDQSRYATNPLCMIDEILPDNLPIDLKGREP